jgi:DNA transformation protein and related proteins
MAIDDGTLDFLKDILAPLGDVTARRMFSGAGIYSDGVIFALYLRDVLYLKADEASIPAFEAEGMGPFTYETSNGERRLTSYWRAPERLFDDADEFVAWARTALAVSHAAKDQPKRAKKRKPAAKSAKKR